MLTSAAALAWVKRPADWEAAASRFRAAAGRTRFISLDFEWLHHKRIEQIQQRKRDEDRNIRVQLRAGEAKWETRYNYDVHGMKLVYVLMTERHDNEQQIYEGMRNFTGMDSLSKALDKGVEFVQGQDDGGINPSSVEQIKKYLFASKGNKVKDLRECLKTKVLSLVEQDSTKLQLSAVDTLEDVVLFIDEVLPACSESKAVDPYQNFRRLRFFRNFGRFLHFFDNMENC